MIRTASRLFRRQGYAATSLSEVVETSQAPRGSIYHHFPGGKEELAREAVGLAARGVGRQIRQLSSSTHEPGQLVRLLFSAFSHALEKSEFREGCPLATLALEIVPSHDALSDATHDAMDAWLEELSRAFQQQGLKPDAASSLAQVVLSALEGSLILARVRRSTDPLSQTAVWLQRQLETNAAS